MTVGIQPNVFKSFDKLRALCEAEGFKGWDPYDGLNSQLFQSIPFVRNNRFSRLAWIQLFKRSPLNLRTFTKVPKDFNAKGLGLFITGYCNLYLLEPKNEYLVKIQFLAEKVLELQSKGYSGSCWGYYFDWQARAFFQPKYTPTVVATSFVADALFNAYEITGEKKWLETALSSANFVLKDLNRTHDEDGAFAFSYSPIDRTQVYNASLLGARLLSRAYNYTKDAALKREAKLSVQYVCKRQDENGSWTYGTLPYHQWIDSFHTGFNLECIHEYEKYTGDSSYKKNVGRGLEFYLENFFTEDGFSKYYHDKKYPLDIHAPAQLMVTLYKLDVMKQNHGLAEKVIDWTIEHMQDKAGFFYYQKKKWSTATIPFMRWAQAWMFYGLTYYLLENKTAS